MANFVFTTTGPIADARTDLAAAPAAQPDFPQAAADFITGQLAAIPDDKTVTITASGDLDWVEGQIAGTLSMAALIVVAS
jgi:hypothetical protein